MRKVAIAALSAAAAMVGAIVVATVPQVRDSLWPAVRAEDTPAPKPAATGVPVTAGTVEAKDMPVILNGQDS